MGDNLKLGYSFGLAQKYGGSKDAPPLVGTGGDSTITDPSKVVSGDVIQGSKIDIFLDKDNKYVNALYQTQATAYTNNDTDASSTWSPDFMIMPSDSKVTTATAGNYSILPSIYSGTSANNSLSNKKYYIGTDKNGNPAYKIVGDLVRTSSTYGKYNLTVEILLRASESGSPVVQRELYVYNPTTESQSFTTMYAEDTALGLLGTTDRSFIYDMGDSRGLIITSRADSSNRYTLLITNKTQDGFNQYAGIGRDIQTHPTNWLNGFKNSKGVMNVNGSGAEAENNKYGTSLFQNAGGSQLVDTAYVLKWNPTVLPAGGVAHFSSTMGAMPQTASSPEVEKSYTNLTSPNAGKNEVSDRLKFTMKVTNNGYDASWSFDKLIDQLPKGLDIDPTTIKESNNGGAFTTLPESCYDSATRTVTVMPSFTLSDNQSATVTFEANVGKGSGTTITNTAQFLGTDRKISGATQQTYKASVDVPISKSAFSYTFSKKVKNDTNGETEYSDHTNAKAGDVLSYETVFTVDDGSIPLTSATNMIDDRPEGLGTPYGVTVQGSTGDPYGQGSNTNTGGIHTVSENQSVTVKFKTKVTATSVGDILSYATITGGLTTKPLENIVSNAITVSIQNVGGITSVPSLVDFGTVNFVGKAIDLKNVETDGQLVVNHPTNTNFSVSVAYNNNDAATQMHNSNGDTLSNGQDNILFFRQRKNAAADLGTWKPIIADGTRLQSDNFKGQENNLNLTEYVGVDDWRLKMDSTTKAGTYKGTLVWSMVDSE